jgi:2-phosphoglycolate phosphatase
VKAIIFDLDGTLIDSTDAIVDSMHHVFDTIGEERPTRAAIIDSIGCPLREQLQILTQHDTDACIAIYRPHYTATAREKTVLLPGAGELLTWLHARGIPIGLATSKKREAAEMLLGHLGVLHYFAVRIGPDEVTHPKPHPEPLLMAAAALGVAPGDAYYIGDMYFDVNAAQAAGMPCIALTTGYCSHAELSALGPEVVLGGLPEAHAYLRTKA